MCILAPNYTRTGKGTLLLCFVKHHAMKQYLGEERGLELFRYAFLSWYYCGN
jgi:hypothetical protein